MTKLLEKKIIKKISFIMPLIFLFFSTFSYGEELYSLDERENIKTAIFSAQNGDWEKANLYAAKVKDPLVIRAVRWLNIKSGNSKESFAQLSNFYPLIKYWPQSRLIRSRIEEAINKETSNANILDWFSENAPINYASKKLHIDKTYLIHKKKSNFSKHIRNTWINTSYSKADEIDYLKSYGKYLTNLDYLAKVDKLIWEKKTDEALRNLPKLDKEHQKLYKARIALINNESKPNEIISKVPFKFKNDPGLLYNLLIWHEKKGNLENIIKLLPKIPLNPPYYDKWWDFKNRQIRTLMENKRYDIAYKLTSTHKNISSFKYTEAEWMSGWLALRFLNSTKLARTHFKNMYKVCQYPVSTSRSAYWVARTFEKEQDAASAKIWYSIAAAYPTTFYGQLSLLKIDSNGKFDLKNNINATEEDYNNFKNNSFARLAIIFSYSQEYEISQAFISQAVKQAKSKGEIFLIAKVGIQLQKLNLSVQAAKDASYKKIIIQNYSYPMIDLKHVGNVEKSFIYALIRQESLFNVSAQSSAGALGIMQIMPKTGQELAKSLKTKYDNNRLHKDYRYNVELGIHYLNKLSKQFNGSYILMAAAYNAGEHNAKDWIKRFGDPREMSSTEEVVDWLESITFYETRNYVQRILESTQIYRSMLNKELNFSSKLEKDIKRNNK